MSPTRLDVLSKLRGLAEGSLAPEGSSGWARPWVTQRDDEVDDIVVMSGLQALHMTDYRKWLAAYVGELNGTDLTADDGEVERGI
jgi:hypothetical protein